MRFDVDEIYEALKTSTFSKTVIYSNGKIRIWVILRIFDGKEGVSYEVENLRTGQRIEECSSLRYALSRAETMI